MTADIHPFPLRLAAMRLAYDRLGTNQSERLRHSALVVPGTDVRSLLAELWHRHLADPKGRLPAADDEIWQRVEAVLRRCHELKAREIEPPNPYRHIIDDLPDHNDDGTPPTG